MKIRKIFALVITPAICVIIAFARTDTEFWKTDITLAIALLMAVWWITEIVPFAITALLPIILFPAFGIIDANQIASSYFNDVIFLFLGGFIVALSIEKWGLHERIALKILLLTGSGPGKVLFGFMFATAALSMWISNTATAMMMIPMCLPVIKSLSEKLDEKQQSRISVGLLLGVAYAASAGGIATLVGTPPNLAFARIFSISFPDHEPISFAKWFFFCFPLFLIIFTIIWTYLYFRFIKMKEHSADMEKTVIRNRYDKLGKLRYEEKAILVIFFTLCLLWMTRASIQIDTVTLTGWTELFPKPNFVTDGVVAIFVAVILFLYPAKSVESGKLMDWKTAKEIPWDIILLFGGGFALTEGFLSSGLTQYLQHQLGFLSGIHPFVMILSIALVITFLTEITSNTATINITLPILAGVSTATNISPLLLMIPATISASMAFMLPIATPPNAIVFSTGKVSISQMAFTGLWLNIIIALIVSIYTFFILENVFVV